MRGVRFLSPKVCVSLGSSGSGDSSRSRAGPKGARSGASQTHHPRVPLARPPVVSPFGVVGALSSRVLPRSLHLLQCSLKDVCIF